MYLTLMCSEVKECKSVNAHSRAHGLASNSGRGRGRKAEPADGCVDTPDITRYRVMIWSAMWGMFTREPFGKQLW